MFSSMACCGLSLVSGQSAKELQTHYTRIRQTGNLRSGVLLSANGEGEVKPHLRFTALRV